MLAADLRHDDVVAVETEDVPSEELRSRTWWIGLSRWVLQDGNFTDFVAGESRQFALEFGYSRSARLRTSGEAQAALSRSVGRGASYQVVGELLRAATAPGLGAFVLDFGLRAYAEWMVLDDLEPPAAGDWLAGQVHLSVDYFAYMDELAQRPGMPALIYTWTVDEIQLHAGPDEGSRLVDDPSRESWRTVDRTRMWDDEGGSYRLRCRLQPVPATTSMAASGSRSPYGPLQPLDPSGGRPPADVEA